MNISYLFVTFMIYSFIGWLMECMVMLYNTKRFINRGFLLGPYCPIYGVGCILMILLLKKYVNDPLVLFLVAMIICAILEYVTSFLMEKIFKTRWWDYNNMRFNINGRICLETMIPFGLLGCLLMYVLNPFFSKILLKLSPVTLNVVAIILAIIFITDVVISTVVLSKIHVSTRDLKVDNSEELTKKAKEYIISHSILGRRVIKSFPNIKMFNLHRKNKEGKKK